MLHTSLPKQLLGTLHKGVVMGNRYLLATTTIAYNKNHGTNVSVYSYTIFFFLFYGALPIPSGLP